MRYIPTFKNWLITESASLAKLELLKLGLLGEKEGMIIVKCIVSWEKIGEKNFYGHYEPFMKCYYYGNWPINTEPEDDWVEYPDRYLQDLYLNDKPGDVEYVDKLMQTIALQNAADLLWVGLDGGLFDPETGEYLGKAKEILY